MSQRYCLSRASLMMLQRLEACRYGGHCGAHSSPVQKMPNGQSSCTFFFSSYQEFCRSVGSSDIAGHLNRPSRQCSISRSGEIPSSAPLRGTQQTRCHQNAHVVSFLLPQAQDAVPTATKPTLRPLLPRESPLPEPRYDHLNVKSKQCSPTPFSNLARIKVAVESRPGRGTRGTWRAAGTVVAGVARHRV